MSIAHSANSPMIGFLPDAVVYHAQESRAETLHSREARNFRRHSRIPYDIFFELVQLAKHRSSSHWLQET